MKHPRCKESEMNILVRHHKDAVLALLEGTLSGKRWDIHSLAELEPAQSGWPTSGGPRYDMALIHLRGDEDIGEDIQRLADGMSGRVFLFSDEATVSDILAAVTRCCPGRANAA